MAEVRPFRALRYNTHDPLSLALVTAPPYDCISPQQQRELQRAHPHNVVRLILGENKAGDDDTHNRYTRAAEFLQAWEDEGILVRDADPSLYFYQQEFRVEGTVYVREGVLARVGLEEFGTGKVFPHEETMDAPRQDRLRLTRTIRANLSPIFSVYPDPENTVTELFHEAIHCDPLMQLMDSDGVIHRLYASCDEGLAERVAEAMAGVPLYIADGHHRYEVAQAYRRELIEKGHDVDEEHPAASVLMLCVSMHHPGLAVLPSHRVLRGVPGLATDRLREASAEHFTWQEFGGAEATSPRLAERLRDAPDHSFGLWTRDTSGAFLLTLKQNDVMDRLAPEMSDGWRRLDVAILERVFLGADLPRAVGGADGLQRDYVHLAQDAFDAVHEDGADAAVLLKPLPVSSLADVAGSGERMPPKSTYFYPKALSGLVINPLD